MSNTWEEIKIDSSSFEYIDLKGLLLRTFIPTAVLSAIYFILGNMITAIPQLLLFLILATCILIPAELGLIFYTSKKEYGNYSLKSAFVNFEKMPIWKILIYGFIFFCIAGLLSSFVTPVEMRVCETVKTLLYQSMSVGFDWTDFAYMKSFSKPIIITLIVFYGFFNVLLGPITEELFFRGYLTSHYYKQGRITPVMISVLFSLYHLWLPFDNLFRILAFLPAYCFTYKKKNIYIGICFHCLCNAFSFISLARALLVS